MQSSRRRYGGDFDQNDGVPGVVYILDNPALAENFYKIGCTRRSGQKRAEDLNAAAATGMPGAYRCVYQYRTADCGRAEKLVFKRLGKFRRGKWGQEFFEIDLKFAKYVVRDSCGRINKAVARKAAVRKRAQEAGDVMRAFARADSPLLRKLVALEARRRFSLQAVCGVVIAASLAVVAAFAIFGPYQG